MPYDLALVIRATIEETVAAFFTDNLGIVAGPSIVKKKDEPYKPPQSDVTAIVGFSGSMQGGVHLSAPMHAAMGLAVAFSGKSLLEFDDIGKDAFGELANIIAGAVKGQIGEQINLMSPQVVTGNDYDISYTKTLESTKCYFRTDNGPFFVEVFFARMD
jgi:chemotaxis protein CheX